MSSTKKVFLGMTLLALSGLMLGVVIGFFVTQTYMNNKVFTGMIEKGYVVTADATATSEDIVGGKTAYASGEKIEGTIEVLDTSDATATADYILKGKTAYINGQLVIGTMPSFVGDEVIATSVAFTIPEGYYLASDVIVKGSPNLRPENIKKGVDIFKVSGSFDGSEQE